MSTATEEALKATLDPHEETRERIERIRQQMQIYRVGHHEYERLKKIVERLRRHMK